MKRKKSIFSARTLAAAIAAQVLLNACANNTPPVSPNFATRNGAAPLARTYRLGIGDKLKVAVFGEENLSGPVEVNAMGQVSMPLIGEMPAKGLSIQEFRDSVARRLADGYLKSPRVTVEVTNYRSIFVHGEVKSGGEFAYKNGITLRDAIAMAGGYTYRADQSSAVLIREGESEVSIPAASNIPVLPGDNIKIPERFF
jgi:protein involved in polysaccharide export with SLBB domain